MSTIHRLVNEGGVDALRKALKEDSRSVNKKDGMMGLWGNTPLHVASGRGDVDVMEVLLEFGAQPSLRNTYGNTPLHSASIQGHERAVSELIPHSRVNAQNNWGETPLHLACRSGHGAVVKLLMEAGADPYLHSESNAGMEERLRAIDVARKYKHTEIVKFLSQHMRANSKRKMMLAQRRIGVVSAHERGDGSGGEVAMPSDESIDDRVLAERNASRDGRRLGVDATGEASEVYAVPGSELEQMQRKIIRMRDARDDAERERDELAMELAMLKVQYAEIVHQDMCSKARSVVAAASTLIGEGERSHVGGSGANGGSNDRVEKTGRVPQYVRERYYITDHTEEHCAIDESSDGLLALVAPYGELRRATWMGRAVSVLQQRAGGSSRSRAKWNEQRDLLLMAQGIPNVISLLAIYQRQDMGLGLKEESDTQPVESTAGSVASEIDGDAAEEVLILEPLDHFTLVDEKAVDELSELTTSGGSEFARFLLSIASTIHGINLCTGSVCGLSHSFMSNSRSGKNYVHVPNVGVETETLIGKCLADNVSLYVTMIEKIMPGETNKLFASTIQELQTAFAAGDENGIHPNQLLHMLHRICWTLSNNAAPGAHVHDGGGDGDGDGDGEGDGDGGKDDGARGYINAGDAAVSGPDHDDCDGDDGDEEEGQRDVGE